ncbi:transposase [Microseira sp. BLCC-F43]|uniref:transposase n=1 Tax=Microseira sp. BLCC-F43 TaxID=3153602 RepID=UPI0035B7D98D
MPDYATKPLVDVKTILGCDLGVTKLLHLSDGYQFDNPKFGINQATRRLLKIRQRRVNRKAKGSKKHFKADKKVGRLHKRIGDKRQAYQWWVAKTVASRRVDAIAIEELNVAGMLRRCRPKKDDIYGEFLPNGQRLKERIEPRYF